MNNKLYYFVFAIFSFSCSPSTSQTIEFRIDSLMKEYENAGLFSGAVLLAKNDSIYYQKGFSLANREYNIPNDVHSRFKISSDTKTFTAQLVLILINKGLLKLEDPVTRFLTDMDTAKFGKIIIHHLLSQTSGIPNDSRLIGVENFDWEEHVLKKITSQGWVQLINQSALASNPGEQFLYSNSNYHLLGAIIEKTTGKEFNEVLQEEICRPLGMTNTIYASNEKVIDSFAQGYRINWELDEKEGIKKVYYHAPYRDASTEGAAGGIISTVGDLYKFYSGLNSYKLLPKQLQDKMFQKNIATPGWTWTWYGYGMGLENGSGMGLDYKLDYSTHGGFGFGHRSQIINIERGKWVIVTLSNIGSATNHWKINKNIVHILNEKKTESIGINPGEILMTKLINEGKDEAWLFFNLTSKPDNPSNYQYTESRLNAAGYTLLGFGKIEEAIEVFKMNIKLFPQSWNAYDSLGEAYKIKGENVLAIQNYQKSKYLGSKNPEVDAILILLNKDL